MINSLFLWVFIIVTFREHSRFQYKDFMPIWLYSGHRLSCSVDSYLHLLPHGYSYFTLSGQDIHMRTYVICLSEHNTYCSSINFLAHPCLCWIIPIICPKMWIMDCFILNLGDFMSLESGLVIQSLSSFAYSQDRFCLPQGMQAIISNAGES